MSIETEKNTMTLIDELTNQIKDIILEGKKTGQLKPQKENYRKWTLNNFKYTDKGVESTGASGETVTRDHWFPITIALNEIIDKSNAFVKLVEKSKPILPDFAKDIIDNFARKIALYCLNNEQWNDEEIEKIKLVLIKELNDEPIKSSIEVELLGIALRSKKIKISNNVSIRQTTKEDLEREVPEHSFGYMEHFEYPSAILSMENYSTGRTIDQMKELKAITILRLFKVGSVKYISAKRSSETLRMYFGGTSFPHDKTPSFITALVKESEEKLLCHFWENIEQKIPISFLRISLKDSSYSDIAYHRYSDALIKEGTDESRITNAMMGLESVYLKDEGEIQELSYRLQLRVAKLISQFGYEPFEVTRIIKDAYDVRSKFVHGGLLNYKARAKLADKYGSMQNLITKILDFLRLTVISSIMIDMDKEELIDTIDKSFLDAKFQDRLEQFIVPTKNIIELK